MSNMADWERILSIGEQPAQYEAIKAPSHYDHPTMPDLKAHQVAAPFGYNIGTAMVYLWRAGRKPGEPAVKDLRKAIEHIQFRIDEIERSEA